MWVESVAKHDRYPDVIVVTTVDLAEMHYLMTDGVLYPGRLWMATAKDGHTVHLFLPMPDGPPSVLEVQSP